MSLLALGLNHKTAPLDIRELASFSPEKLGESLRELKNIVGVEEAAIVSTCNRTEIYCGLDNDSVVNVVEWMHQHLHVPPEKFSPYLFKHFDQNAVQHLLRVCSGLDSMVLGEPQILGQIKQAFQLASENGTIGRQLTQLFQHAFSVSKQIRTDTAIGNSPVSIAFAAVSLAKQIFGDLRKQTALLIGAGETIELAARHLYASDTGSMIIANRTLKRAQLLGEEYSARAIEIRDIPGVLHEADIVIASTAAPLPILGKGAVEQALKVRKHQPIFMVDIAVPRDIEPQVADLDDVFLYTVDDLQNVVEEGRKSRQQAADQAEEIILAQVDLFMRKLRAMSAMGTIRDFRQNAGELQELLIQQGLQQLEHGADPAEVLRRYAHNFTNKLLHTPSVRLREAGEEGRLDIIESATVLFGLDKKQT
ncbi:MAG: glutamyl-tRNA reductase [Gammaproteobacteria bacterium]|nr:glutamyl-tRNA reductase [Gammaproteobacteria bacterium]